MKEILVFCFNIPLLYSALEIPALGYNTLCLISMGLIMVISWCNILLIFIIGWSMV